MPRRLRLVTDKSAHAGKLRAPLQFVEHTRAWDVLLLMARLGMIIRVGALACGLLGTAQATEDPRETEHQPGMFVMKAIQGDMMELALAAIARSRSTTDDVKAVADHMTADHTRIQKELAEIARRNEIKVPTQLDSTHEAIVDDLEKKSGSDFDTAYAHQMAVAHDEAISRFIQASQDSNADLAEFAKRELPTLRAHKEMIARLVKRTAQSSHPPSEKR